MPEIEFDGRLFRVEDVMVGGDEEGLPPNQPRAPAPPPPQHDPRVPRPADIIAANAARIEEILRRNQRREVAVPVGAEIPRRFTLKKVMDMGKGYNVLDLHISELVALRHKVKGDMFGVELEMEGRNLAMAKDYILCDWVSHVDGSLRNYHGEAIEWVTNRPESYEDTVKKIDRLFKGLAENRAKVVPSNRTSTHVHFNMGDKKVYQLTNLFIYYTLIEDVLGHFAGDDRNGNVFCLRNRDASATIQMFYNSVVTYKNLGDFNGNNRYSALNLCSLFKFGTVEFRQMRGVDKPDDLLTWLKLLNRLIQFSMNSMQAPSEVIEFISVGGPIGFLNQVFGPELTNKLVVLYGSEREVCDSIYEGVREVQHLAYAVSPNYEGLTPPMKDFWAQQKAGLADYKARIEEDDDVEGEQEDF